MEFKDMNVSNDLIELLGREGIVKPTKIQVETIPFAMNGQDIRAQSETGSGKTLGFGIPMIEKFTRGAGIQGLILAPTRELAKQICDELKKFSRHKRLGIVTVYGGASMNSQISALPRADIVVGTPGRILDLIGRNALKFDTVKVVVLDEADRMLDMGFVADIEEILRSAPKQRQTMLFSATFPEAIKSIAKRYLVDPKKVVVESTLQKGKLIQMYFDVNQKDKYSLLVHMLKKNVDGLSLIFCNTKKMTEILASNLTSGGLKSKALNGDMSQKKRDLVVEDFKSGRLKALVATDVAARGIHVDNITHVYNYDIPKDSETYTHRIGRTARAGQTGEAISLVSNFDYDNFGRIESERRGEMKRCTEAFERIPFNLRGGKDDSRRRGGRDDRGNGRERDSRSSRSGGNDRFPRRDSNDGRRSFGGRESGRSNPRSGERSERDNKRPSQDNRSKNPYSSDSFGASGFHSRR